MRDCQTLTWIDADPGADIAEALSCECVFRSHWPHGTHRHCPEMPIYMVRVRHVDRCEDPVMALCQNCLDAEIASAGRLVGRRCPFCKTEIGSVADLVGPILPIVTTS